MREKMIVALYGTFERRLMIDEGLMDCEVLIMKMKYQLLSVYTGLAPERELNHLK
jgi:hypothetical protein